MEKSISKKVEARKNLLKIWAAEKAAAPARQAAKAYEQAYKNRKEAWKNFQNTPTSENKALADAATAEHRRLGAY